MLTHLCKDHLHFGTVDTQRNREVYWLAPKMTLVLHDDGPKTGDRASLLQDEQRGKFLGRIPPNACWDETRGIRTLVQPQLHKSTASIAIAPPHPNFRWGELKGIERGSENAREIGL
jgi:hypothetical protein